MTLEAITVKVLTVADLHQSKTLYEQLEKAVRLHTPDLAAVIGDCLYAVEGSRLTITLCLIPFARWYRGKVVRYDSLTAL